MSKVVGELAILQLIRSRAATSQIELAHALGLPANTVHGIVKRIEAKGLVFEQRQQRGKRGRPSVHYGVSIPGHVLVIKWMGTDWQGLVVGQETGAESQIARLSSPTVPNITAAAAHLTRLRDLALKNSGLRLEELDGAIVMLNAMHALDGRLTSSVIPWVGEITEAFLSETLKCPTMISENLHAAEMELRRWTREDARSLAVFNVGDGVSAHYATLAGPWGQIESLPGQVGHIEREPGGDLCGCGNRGCLETVLAGGWVQHRVLKDISNGAQTVLGNSLSKSPREFFHDINAAAIEGEDFYARRLIDGFIAHCAWGLSVAIHMFQPDIIVVEGYAFEDRWHWVERITRALPPGSLQFRRQELRLERQRRRPMDEMREMAAEFFMSREGIPA